MDTTLVGYKRLLVNSSEEVEIGGNGMFSGLKLKVLTKPLPPGIIGLYGDTPENSVFIMEEPTKEKCMTRTKCISDKIRMATMEIIDAKEYLPEDGQEIAGYLLDALYDLLRAQTELLNRTLQTQEQLDD